MKIKNLGVVREASIDSNNMNIFYGKNTNGKTYVSYSIYGVLSEIREHINHIVTIKDLTLNKYKLTFTVNKDELINKILNSTIGYINYHSKEIIYKAFANKFDKGGSITIDKNDLMPFVKKTFQDQPTKHNRILSKTSVIELISFIKFDQEEQNLDFSFSIEERDNFFDDDDNQSYSVQISDLPSDLQNEIMSDINNVVIDYIYEINNVIYFPAERAGINVFRNEINKNRSDRVSKKEETVSGNYPLAIADYLVFLNFVSNLSEFFNNKEIREDRWDIWSTFLKNIIQGKFEEKDNEIFFRGLYGNVIKGKKTKYQSTTLPLSLISSSIKSLYGLDFYIKNMYTSRDVLFIDEPEMNLDPEKQLFLSEILFKLSQFGVKVYISTHSDFILRYFTNISLKETLEHKESVSIFHFDNHTVNKIQPSESSENYFEYFDLQYEKLQDDFINLIDQLENNDAYHEKYK